MAAQLTNVPMCKQCIPCGSAIDGGQSMSVQAGIWNPKDCELVLAGDYMAVRHLFYFVTQHRIWWSSDLGPLVLLSPEKLHVDDEYVAGYLTREPSGSVTPYREIREVPPGHLLRVCCKRLS